MAGERELQLARFVDARDIGGLFTEVGEIFSASFPSASATPLEQALEITRTLFEGRFPGYRACNSEYHDLRHTLSVILAVARLAYGYNLARAPPPQRLVL